MKRKFRLFAKKFETKNSLSIRGPMCMDNVIELVWLILSDILLIYKFIELVLFKKQIQ